MPERAWFKPGNPLTSGVSPTCQIGLTAEVGGFARLNHGLTRLSSFCREIGDLVKKTSWRNCFRPSRDLMGCESPEGRLQEAISMLQLMLFPDNLPRPRWANPPWTPSSPPWLELDRELPPDDRARLIDR